VTEPRDPELPFDDEDSPVAPTGPRDQIGFDDLGPPRGEDPVGPETTESEADDGDAMGLLDHLDELRTVLIHSSIAGLAATVLCWFWSAPLLDIMIRPIKSEGIYFTAPNEAFLTRLKLSGAVGLFVIAPFIFFKFYGFILPGLYRQERKVVTPLLIATSVLFYLGVAFGFMVVIPQVMTFLLGFGTDNLTPLIGVGPYFGFVSRLCLAFGLVFELPLLVFFLSVTGLVDPKMLLRTWRYATVLIAVLSAILTPPDAISQVMMAGPVFVLYIGSVLVSLVVTRKKRRARELENEQLDKPDME